MMKRRTFLGGAWTSMSAGSLGARSATAQAVVPAPAEPLVWPVVTKVPPGIRAFAGHTDTVPDIVGRLGTPASLVIFTEGNHLMVLLSEDVVGAFPAWARTQPAYADLDAENMVVVTLPQPVVVQMIRTGGLALGNLMLDVSRKSGFYPDIVMAGPDPLRQLRKLGAIERQARFFSKNQGPAMLLRKGNPLGIHSLADITRVGARVALPDVQEAEARARYRAALDGLIGHAAAGAVFAAEAPPFRGRIGVVHRDFPEMIARGYADVGITQYHLVSYWTRIFPDHFELVPIPGADQHFVKIAFGRTVDPLRRRAAQAFEEFFFARAREVYPRHDFARMTDDEYGAVLALD